ncbi:hypothetical protein ACHAXT_004282 [Thalassiosira profunda]
MKRYKLPEAEARESIMDQCGIDYHNEPYVLIHAGPHKTGTTLIQSFLYHSLWKEEPFLQEDKFAIPTFEDLPGVFGDTGPMLNYAHCMISGYVKEGGQMNVAFCNRLRKAFPPFLQTIYNASQHTFIIAEDLDRLTIDHGRMQYYLRPYRRFRVIVSYRRLHDWLPSFYNQIVDLYLQEYIQGRSKFPSFVQWIDEQYDHFIKVHAIEVAARYRSSGKFEEVVLLNMHDGTPLLENLFCNKVRFANSTCQAIRDGAKSTKPNVGSSHEYERLATKAALRGKLKNYHRANAKQKAAKIKQAAVERGIFGDANSYPTICLNRTFMDKILQTEMEQERVHFPEWYESQGGDQALRKDFEKAERKLCSLDEEKILDSGLFDSIFEEINGA